MGNSQSQTFDQSKFTSEWQLKERNSTNHAIYQKKQAQNLQIQQYPIFARGEEDVNDFRQLYDLRKNNEELVKAYYLKEVHQSGMCSSGAQGKLYLERIEIRLSNLQHVPYPDVLHLFFNALKGYRLLARQVGWFRPQQEQVGFNSSGQCKVWLSHEFAAIHPTIMQGSQASMVHKVLQIIEDNTDQQTFLHSCPNVTQFILQNTDPNKLTFDDALIRLREYSNAYNNGQIPRFMECIRQVGVEAIARSLKEDSLNTHVAQLKKQEQINMKRSHDQFFTINGSNIHSNGSANNLMKNSGNFKSMNNFALYQPVSSPKNSIILHNNNISMAPVNFAKPQSVIIQQNSPLSQGYRNPSQLQAAQMIQPSFRPSVQLSGQTNNQRPSVKLNQVNVPFVQSPPQVMQISKLPEKELIRSPIKMIVQTPVMSPMNGAMRSPVQTQLHPIHVLQQQTTPKFTHPINQTNYVVPQQNFPVQNQKIIIPQQPGQVTQIINPQPQQQNATTSNQPQILINNETNQIISTQPQNQPPKPQPITQQHTNEQVQIQEPSEQASQNAQHQVEGYEAHQEGTAKDQNHDEIQLKDQNLIQGQLQGQHPNLGQETQLDGQQPITKLQQFISNDQLPSQPNTLHVIQPELQTQVASEVKQPQIQSQNLRQDENNTQKAQQLSQGHLNGNQTHKIAQQVICPSNQPISQPIPVVISNQNQTIQPTILQVQQQGNKMVQFNASMNSQTISVTQVNNQGVFHLQNPHQIRPIMVQPPNVTRQPVIINNQGQVIRTQRPFPPSLPQNIIPPHRLNRPSPQQIARPSTLVNHPMALNHQVRNVSGTVRPQQLGSRPSHIIFNHPQGNRNPSMMNSPIVYSNSAMVYNIPGPQIIGVGRGPQQVVLNGQMQQIPLMPQPVCFVQMNNGQQQIREVIVPSEPQKVQSQQEQVTVEASEAKDQQQQSIKSAQQKEQHTMQQPQVNPTPQADLQAQPQKSNLNPSPHPLTQPDIQPQHQETLMDQNLGQLNNLQPQLKLIVSTEEHLVVAQGQLRQGNVEDQQQYRQCYTQVSNIQVMIVPEQIQSDNVASHQLQENGQQHKSNDVQQSSEQLHENNCYDSSQAQLPDNQTQNQNYHTNLVQYHQQQQLLYQRQQQQQQYSRQQQQQQQYQSHQHYQQQQAQYLRHQRQLQQYNIQKQQQYQSQQRQQAEEQQAKRRRQFQQYLQYQRQQVQEYERQQQEQYQREQQYLMQQRQYEQEYRRQQQGEEEEYRRQQQENQRQQEEEYRRQQQQYYRQQKELEQQYNRKKQQEVQYQSQQHQYQDYQRQHQQYLHKQQEEQQQQFHRQNPGNQLAKQYHAQQSYNHSLQHQTKLYHPITSSRANNIITSNTVSIQIPTQSQQSVSNQPYHSADQTSQYTQDPSQHGANLTPEQIFHAYSGLNQQQYQTMYSHMNPTAYKQELYDNLDDSKQMQQLQDLKENDGDISQNNQKQQNNDSQREYIDFYQQGITYHQGNLSNQHQNHVQNQQYNPYQQYDHQVTTYSNQFKSNSTQPQPQPQLQLSQEPYATQKPSYTYQAQKYTLPANPTQTFPTEFTYTPSTDLYQPLPTAKTPVNQQKHYENADHSPIMEYMEYEDLKRKKSQLQKQLMMLDGHSPRGEDKFIYSQNDYIESSNSGYFNNSGNPKDEDYTYNQIKTDDYVYKPFSSNYQSNPTYTEYSFNPTKYDFTSTSFPQTKLKDQFKSMNFGSSTNYKDINLDDGKSSLDILNAIKGISSSSKGNNLVESGLVMNSSKFASKNYEAEGQYSFLKDNKSTYLNEEKPYKFNENFSTSKVKYDDYTAFPTINSTKAKDYTDYSVGSYDYFPSIGSENKFQFNELTNLNTFTGSRLKQKQPTETTDSYDMTMPKKSSQYSFQPSSYQFGIINRTEYSNTFESQRAQSNNYEQNQYQVDYDPEILADLQKLS